MTALRTSATLALTALIAACTQAPKFVVTYEDAGPPRPVGPLLQAPRHVEVSQVPFAASPALGLCVNTETISRPTEDSARRTSGSVNCGLSNQNVVAALQAANTTPQLYLYGQTGRYAGDPRRAPEATSYRSTTFTFNDSVKLLTCTANVVLVAPATPVRGLTAGTAIPEFGDYTVPQGWKVPVDFVKINGRAVTSTLSCTQLLGIR